VGVLDMMGDQAGRAVLDCTGSAGLSCPRAGTVGNSCSCADTVSHKFGRRGRAAADERRFTRGVTEGFEAC